MDEWNHRREELERNLLDALGALFEHTGSDGFVTSFDEDGTVFLAAGSAQSIRDRLDELTGPAAPKKIYTPEEIDDFVTNQLPALREALGEEGTLVFSPDLTEAFPVDWDERLHGYKMRQKDAPPPGQPLN
jgi:hypothetical protein